MEGGCDAATRASTALASKVTQEESAIRIAADALLGSLPQEMILYGSSSVPAAERLAMRRDAMMAYDAGTIRKAHAALGAWLAFCARHQLPNYGAPFDEEMCMWFLREEDLRARERASGRRSGATVKNSVACSLRWLRTTLLIPFAAETQPVRKAARVQRAAEPKWTEMWPVGVLQHLLRLAMQRSASARRFIRAYAAGAYMLCAASLRQIDGLRSQPPRLLTVGSEQCFHAVASLTKGRCRAHMQPLPWWVPAVSPIAGVANDEVEAGLSEAFSLLPKNSLSLFPAALDARGREVPISRAVRWGDAPATPRHLSASIADILHLEPLALPRAEACKLGGRRHGPRHTLPEIARVAGMAAAAREEIGRWKSSRGRLNTLSNRYSRDGERILQCQLRGQLLQWIALRAGRDLHAPLEAFVATQAELDAATAASTQAMRARLDHEEASASQAERRPQFLLTHRQ